MLRIDPVTNLGLSAESVFSYHIGDIVRTKGMNIILYRVHVVKKRIRFLERLWNHEFFWSLAK